MRQIVPIIFFTVVGLAVYYLSRRIAWAFKLSPKLTFAVVAAIVTLVMVTMSVIMRSNSTSTLSHILFSFSAISLGVFALTIGIFLVVDAVQLFAKFKSRNFGYIAVGLSVLASVYALWNAQNTKLYNIDIKLPNLVQPLRIAQFSDIHIGHFWGKRTVDKLVRLVEHENLDAIVITGDMFDGRVRLNEDAIEPLKRLSAPIYFVEGNHDGASGAEDIKSLLRRNGITVLQDSIANVKDLQIVGLKYMLADMHTANSMHIPHNKGTMQSVLPTLDIDSTRASILLHHNPVGLQYAAKEGIGLYLAGHTHAGQMFPSTILAHFLFEYNKGLYRFNDSTQIYVSQGSGTFGPPMRLGTHSEVTIFNFTKQ